MAQTPITCRAMKTRKHCPTRNSAIHRVTRNAAVSERRRRLSLWQFYQAGAAGLETPFRPADLPLTEPSSR